MKSIIEVFIPTYNRPSEFKKCLSSLENCLTNVSKDNRSKIGIAVRNNSTDNFFEYENLIKAYAKKFSTLGIAYFDYLITGFNVGGINNVAGGLFSCKSDYIWFLPDDDVARYDALTTLIPIIEIHQPCFISGGCKFKSKIENYSSNENGSDDGVENKVLDVITDNSKIISYLSSKNVVQAQEYVYNVKILKKFIFDKSNLDLLHDMYPGIFAIFCLQSDKPFVRLERSLGIFRAGEPNSEWRHLWWRLALIDWPKISKKLYSKGWLNREELKISIKLFRHIFPVLTGRADILFGINWKSKVNPILLLIYHPKNYIVSLFKTPFITILAIIKKLKKKFNCKVK